MRIEARNEDDPSADSNMAGKSTILEALLWGLFGKTLRGLKHGQIIHRGTTTAKVCVDFSIETRNYRVVRVLGKKPRLKLFAGTRDISHRHIEDTQRELERILCCDYATFVNSTVFGGFDGNRKQFALLTDKEQKKILDSFMRFEKFNEALERTKDTLFETKKQLHETELKLERQRTTVFSVRERIQTLERGVRVFRARERKDRRKVLKRLKSLPTVEKPSMRLVKRANESLEASLTEKVRWEEKRHAVLRRIKSISKRGLRLGRMLGKPCPACGQIVKQTRTLTQHLKRDKAKLDSRIEKIDRHVRKAESEVNRGRKRLKRLSESYHQQLHQFDSASEKRKGLEEALRRTPVPFLNELESYSKEYSKQTSRLLLCNSELAMLKSRVADLEFWVVGFGNKGVKALIMREMLPAMNQKLKEFAREIFQTEVELEFKPAKENKKGEERELFHLHYKSKHDSTNYTGESSGGRRRVDVCVLLTLAWMSRVSDCLLVDELLDGLDAAGRELVLQILSRQRGTVLVISHERDLKSKIGRVWTVCKRDGESTLEIAA